MDILDAPLANDANFHSPGGGTTPLGWAQIYLGTNNDGGAIDSLTMYFDNVTISANEAIPEPTSIVALGVIGLALVSRRKR